MEPMNNFNINNFGNNNFENGGFNNNLVEEKDDRTPQIPLPQDGIKAIPANQENQLAVKIRSIGIKLDLSKIIENVIKPEKNNNQKLPFPHQYFM